MASDGSPTVASCPIPCNSLPVNEMSLEEEEDNSTPQNESFRRQRRRSLLSNDDLCRPMASIEPAKKRLRRDGTFYLHTSEQDEKTRGHQRNSPLTSSQCRNIDLESPHLVYLSTSNHPNASQPMFPQSKDFHDQDATTKSPSRQATVNCSHHDVSLSSVRTSSFHGSSISLYNSIGIPIKPVDEPPPVKTIRILRFADIDPTILGPGVPINPNIIAELCCVDNGWDTNRTTVCRRALARSPSSTPSLQYANEETLRDEDMRLNDFIKIMQIGQGAYGDVWLAEDIKKKRLVALKKLKLNEEREGFPKNAIREISLLRYLRHPNIVGFFGMVYSRPRLESLKPIIPLTSYTPGSVKYGFGTTLNELMEHASALISSESTESKGFQKKEGSLEDPVAEDMKLLYDFEGAVFPVERNRPNGSLQPMPSQQPSRSSVWMAFEYLPYDLNGIIEQLRDQDKQLTVAEVKLILRDILLALEFCHSHNVMHRDLKSANLLISSDGRVKLADFGLARHFNASTVPLTNRVITLWYRPPELLLGAEVYTPSVDIWSAGCIFAELVINRAIFGADNEPKVLRAIAESLGPPSDIEWAERVFLPYWNSPEVNPLLPMACNEASITSVQSCSINLSTTSTKMGVRGDNLWQKLSDRGILLSRRIGPMGLSLLKSMLRYNPKDRITARDALNHTWFSVEGVIDGLPLHRFQRSHCHAFALRRDRERQREIQRMAAHNQSTPSAMQNQIRRQGPRIVCNTDYLEKTKRAVHNRVVSLTVGQETGKPQQQRLSSSSSTAGSGMAQKRVPTPEKVKAKIPSSISLQGTWERLSKSIPDPPPLHDNKGDVLYRSSQPPVTGEKLGSMLGQQETIRESIEDVRTSNQYDSNSTSNYAQSSALRDQRQSRFDQSQPPHRIDRNESANVNTTSSIPEPPPGPPPPIPGRPARVYSASHFPRPGNRIPPSIPIGGHPYLYQSQVCDASGLLSLRQGHFPRPQFPQGHLSPPVLRPDISQHILSGSPHNSEPHNNSNHRRSTQPLMIDDNCMDIEPDENRTQQQAPYAETIIIKSPVEPPPPQPQQQKQLSVLSSMPLPTSLPPQPPPEDQKILEKPLSPEKTMLAKQPIEVFPQRAPTKDIEESPSGKSEGEITDTGSSTGSHQKVAHKKEVVVIRAVDTSVQTIPEKQPPPPPGPPPPQQTLSTRSSMLATPTGSGGHGRRYSHEIGKHQAQRDTHQPLIRQRQEQPPSSSSHYYQHQHHYHHARQQRYPQHQQGRIQQDDRYRRGDDRGSQRSASESQMAPPALSQQPRNSFGSAHNRCTTGFRIIPKQVPKSRYNSDNDYSSGGRRYNHGHY